MKRKSGKNSLKNKGIIVCAVIAVALCVWTSVFSLMGGTDVLREAAVLISSPFTSLFDSVGQGVSRAAGALAGTDEVQKAHEEEIEALKNTIAAQELEISRLQQMKQENEQLRAYLSLAESHPTLLLTEARTIYSSDTTMRSITLDKGSRDGIAVGMPVLDVGGLVGVVDEVTLNSCKVKTVLDETLKIGVRNARSGVSATLSGTPAGKSYCVMTYMDPATDAVTDLAIGDVIVTAGNSELFPAGLIVGRISQLDLKAQLPCAHVRPAADPSSATSLLLIVTGEDTTPPEEIPEGENPGGDEYAGPPAADSPAADTPTVENPNDETNPEEKPVAGQPGDGNPEGGESSEQTPTTGGESGETDTDTDQDQDQDPDEPVQDGETSEPVSGGSDQSDVIVPTNPSFGNDDGDEAGGFAGEEVPLS